MNSDGGDALYLTDNLSEAISIIQMRDELLGRLSGTSVWEYNIPTRTMRISYVAESGETKNVVIEHYNSAVKEAQLIYQDDIPVFDVFCAELDAGKEHIFTEFRKVSERYQYEWFRYLGNAVTDEETGKVETVFGRCYEVTSEKNAQDQSETDSSRDILTGLNKKNQVKRQIERELAKGSVRASLILVDIDRFHEINESYGKMYGDEILQTVSGMIYTSFMAKDIVGRIAGDQFIIFCCEIDPPKAVKLVQKMRERLREHVSVRDGRQITASVGLAHCPVDGTTYDELYLKADLALAKAKQTGGNCFAEYEHSAMKDLSSGFTILKKDLFADDMNRMKDHGKALNKILFDYTFDMLTSEPDLLKAVQKIFEEVCLFYHFDRAFLIGADFETHSIDTVVHWRRNDDGDDLEKMKSYFVNAWDEFNDAAIRNETPYFIMEAGRGYGLDFFRQIVTLNGIPESAIIFPILDHKELSCIITFDAFEKREFSDNEIYSIESIVRLISSYMISRQTRFKLQTESLLNRSVMDAQKTVYYVIDTESYKIRHVGKYARSFFKRIEYGQKCYECFYDRSEPCETCPLLSGEQDKTIEVYDEKKDRWYTYTAMHLEDPGYTTDSLICITDVTEFLHRVKGEDSLTQVDSYDKFMLLATKAVVAAENSYTIMAVGIDGFAKINDEYGYVVGDEILKSLAALLRKDVEEDEFLCRIKGDDFLVFLKSGAEEDLKARIARYSSTLTAEYRAEYPGIRIDLFAGAYRISSQEQYFNRCLDKAMRARKVAKEDIEKNGGFYLYTKEFEQYERELEEMKDRIRYALKNDGFVVYLQPKVEVSTGQIVGAEALVRMKDRDGKLIPPGLFIPLAEKAGMVVEIDETVYEKTFSYMSRWKKMGKKVPLISVNVSRIHLLDDNLPEHMSELVRKHGITPNEVELEVTESVFFEDTERLISMIKRLKEMGFIISMDDFGSGYSTLNFMKSLPVDVIKIDGGFFMHNEMDQKNKAVISAIMQLSQNLHFETVSEGVETEEQVRFIREQGGKSVQGYYFYKPMPAEEFEKLI